MTEISSNNKRIAKNTLYLYFRMFITMIVGLYTSRVVLNALGVSDYGIDNVVGGFVGMFSYANVLLYNGSLRFITIAQGKGDLEKQKHVFSACLTIHTILAVITLVLLETIGVWFLNTHLNIPANRMVAANWVFQFACFGTFLGIMQVPYGVSVIAHEKMSIYAYMSIFDVVMKLVVVFLLFIVDADKLILYTFFYFIINCLVIIFYRWYCIHYFQECGFRMAFDKKLYKEIFNYVGWSAVGTFAAMANGQGVNILLNMYFGTVVNASRGIAYKVSGLVNKFVSNFQMAVNPQTMKYFAQGKYEEMNRLIFNNSKYSAFLLLLIGLPVFFETRFLIQLWLGQIPDYVIPFARLTIIQIFIQALDYPIGTGIQATGKMKLPNITSSIVYLAILPITYISLKFFHTTPVTSYIVVIIAYPIAMCCDLWIINKYTGFSILGFFKEVIAKVFLITSISLIAPITIYCLMPDNTLRFFVLSITTVCICGTTIFKLGLNERMRLVIKQKIQEKLFLSQIRKA